MAAGIQALLREPWLHNIHNVSPVKKGNCELASLLKCYFGS